MASGIFVLESGRILVSLFFLDRQACNNSAAYLFLPQVGSILTNYGFGAGCHPPSEWRGFQEICARRTGTEIVFMSGSSNG